MIRPGGDQQKAIRIWFLSVLILWQYTLLPAGGTSYFDLRRLDCEVSSGRSFDDNIHRCPETESKECDNITSGGLNLKQEIVIQQSVKLMFGYGLEIEDYDRDKNLDNSLNAMMISGGKSLLGGHLRFYVSEEWQFRRGPSAYYKYNAENLSLRSEWLLSRSWRVSGGYRHRFLDYLSEHDDYMGKSNFVNTFSLGLMRQLQCYGRIRLTGLMNRRNFKHFIVLFDEDGGYRSGDDIRREKYAEARLDLETYIFSSVVINFYGILGRNSSNNFGFDYDDGSYGIALISERKDGGEVLMVVTVDYQRYERSYREFVPVLPILLEDVYGEENDQNVFSFSLRKYLSELFSISAKYQWIERYGLDYKYRYRKNVISTSLSYNR